MGKVVSQLDQNGKANSTTDDQAHCDGLQDIVVGKVLQGVSVDVKACIGKSADGGKKSVVVSLVPILVIACDQEIAAEQNGPYKLDYYGEYDDVAHQFNQAGQGWAIVVGCDPLAVLQANSLPQHHPKKGSQCHNPDSANLKEQRKQNNPLLIKDLMNRNYVQSGYANGAGCSKHGIDEGEPHTWKVEKRQP